MISREVGVKDCFVYLTTPGETQAVTAGRFELTSDRGGVATGRFVYGRSYLARPDAVEIDPVELKLGTTVFETVLHSGVFGALRDAGPDFWGRRVIEKHAQVTSLGEIDYLLHSPDDRAGALGFGLGKFPPSPLRRFNQTFDLERLQEIADALYREEIASLGEAEVLQAEDLLLIGTSMGGARPKAVVEDSEGLWLAKFNRPDDRWNSARVEHAMTVLGKVCGLTTCLTRIEQFGKTEALLVKRFDREKTDGGYFRARMISALTLLRAGDDLQSRAKWSYVSLAEELRRISAEPKRDAEELFRRMCFNALISNTDDHPRNHAVIALNRDWRLSPAYDLTPSTPIGLERRDLAMECGRLGRLASAVNLVSQSARFLLSREEATRIVTEMSGIIRSKWYEVARSCGVSETDCGKISGAFVYPGFEQ